MSPSDEGRGSGEIADVDADNEPSPRRTGGPPAPAEHPDTRSLSRGLAERTLSRRLAHWIDDRLGTAGVARTALGKVFPDHWSFLVGEIALYSFIVLVATGIYLTFFYNPSVKVVTYHGPYVPLQGQHVSQAYQSALRLSFEVRGGLVMRQMHHWAALLFLAAIAVHMMRIFFTGAFRRPRELNWIVGCTLLLMGIVNGFLGYSLLDDQLSGTGLRIAYGVVLSVPLIGTWLASLLFGGNFPGDQILGRFYALHIMLVPGAIVGLISVHLAILVWQKHTQFPGPHRTERNVVGERVWPRYAAKALGWFFLTTGVLAGLGGLFQINAIWLYGPFNPSQVSAASQPDWYMGWLEGALRTMPPFEIRAFGFEVPNPFFPAVLLPGLTFTTLYLWPFLEAKVTGDHRPHHLLDRPRQRPARTGLGVAALTFYAVLTFAGASDVISTTFSTSVNTVIWTFRVALVVLPIITGRMAWALCRELCARDNLPISEVHWRLPGLHRGRRGRGRRKRGRTTNPTPATLEAQPID